MGPSALVGGVAGHARGACGRVPARGYEPCATCETRSPALTVAAWLKPSAEEGWGRNNLFVFVLLYLYLFTVV